MALLKGVELIKIGRRPDPMNGGKVDAIPEQAAKRPETIFDVKVVVFRQDEPVQSSRFRPLGQLVQRERPACQGGMDVNGKDNRYSM